MSAAAWGNLEDLPDFSDEVVNGVPGDGAISDGTPPAHQVGWFHISVGMEVIRDGYFCIAEGRGDETDTKFGSVRRCGYGKGLNGGG